MYFILFGKQILNQEYATSVHWCIYKCTYICTYNVNMGLIHSCCIHDKNLNRTVKESRCKSHDSTMLKEKTLFCVSLCTSCRSSMTLPISCSGLITTTVGSGMELGGQTLSSMILARQCSISSALKWPTAR